MAVDFLKQVSRMGHDPELCKGLLRRLEETLQGRFLRFMEVCGTHTMSIFQSGLRSLLGERITHLSGPGCPVCVTHDAEIALFLEIANRPDVVIATFGDLMRVPGPDGRSLKHAQAEGAQIRVIYSPLDALRLAMDNPAKHVVFPGIGFETTAPTVAATILSARRQGVGNFSVLSLHKLVAPALRALLQEDDEAIDAFLLPGHVAVVTGLAPFEFVASEYGKPAVVGGFEPADILLALCEMACMLVGDKPAVVNTYERAVTPSGNVRARQIMETVFQSGDALWRGLDLIPASGLVLRPEFSEFDAMKRLGLTVPEVKTRSGCRCGAVLKGALSPDKCPLFGKVCTPATPIGPCMVSSEGSCAAWFKYGMN